MFALDRLEKYSSLLFDLKDSAKAERATPGGVTNFVLHGVSEPPVFLLSCIPRLVANRFMFFVRSCSKSQRIS